MNLEEKKLSEEYIYKGKIINLRRDNALLPDGTQALREVVEHNGGVCVAAVTEKGEILLVKQYRYPYGEEIWEIPAGKRDSKTEEPLSAGKRELKEETGAQAKDFLFLGELYPTPGYCGEIIYMYAAKNLTYGDSNPDDDEFLLVEKMPMERVVEKIMSGEIKDAKTQAAVLKLKYLMDNGEF
ncbi:MAG: NUDIX hydrolase [Clostridiales bacterium]|nr:NUDIX hydrolase [Candidatus Equinaster intestinalis]